MCGVGRESEARDDRDLVSQPLMHRPQSQVSRVINLNLARKNVVLQIVLWNFVRTSR